MIDPHKSQAGFDRIIGHERPLNMVKAMLARGRLPHALLITGPAGIGKYTLALALAQAVNCEQPERGEPCGICPACGKIERGAHPDVVVLEPEGRTRVIKIDAVRELRNQVAYHPFEGRTKVFIIRQAERMGNEAANALLKTLEEPPPQSLILLTAPEETDLLPTVVSRCLRLGLAPLSRQLIIDWLRRERDIDESEARLLATLAGGCLGRVTDIEPVETRDKQREIVEKLGSLTASRSRETLTWAEELAGAEEERPRFFDLARFWYRDLMILAANGGEHHLVHTDFKEELHRRVKGHGPETFIAALKEIDDAEEALERMVRPDLVMENLMFNLAQIQEGYNE